MGLIKENATIRVKFPLKVRTHFMTQELTLKKKGVKRKAPHLAAVD